MNKKIFFKCLIFSLSLTFIFLLAKSNDIYAIEKPTYEDLIRGKYGDELDEGKIKSLAQEESILKETYAKGIANTVKEQMELQNNSISYYGKYPNGFTGAVNYRRNNFLLLCYSLRDILEDEGMQPLMSSNIGTTNYQKQGFNISSWNRYGMTSKNTIKWLVNQFEIKKLLRVYDNVDYLILNSIYQGDYKKIIDEKDNIFEVVSLVGTNGLEFLSEGDLLLNYDDKNDNVNYVGIFLGKDEEDNYYSLSPNKLACNSSDYALNVWALSYINTSNVYPQMIDNKLNLISGTKYNYGIKLKFLN